MENGMFILSYAVHLGIVNINILVIVFEYKLILYRYDLQKHQSYQITPTDYYISLPISGDVNLEYIKEHGYTGLFCTMVKEYDAVQVGRAIAPLGGLRLGQWQHKAG
jgi:hypothetical protein